MFCPHSGNWQNIARGAKKNRRNLRAIAPFAPPHPSEFILQSAPKLQYTRAPSQTIQSYAERPIIALLWLLYRQSQGRSHESLYRLGWGGLYHKFTLEF